VGWSATWGDLWLDMPSPARRVSSSPRQEPCFYTGPGLSSTGRVSQGASVSSNSPSRRGSTRTGDADRRACIFSGRERCRNSDRSSSPFRWRTRSEADLQSGGPDAMRLVWDSARADRLGSRARRVKRGGWKTRASDTLRRELFRWALDDSSGREDER
jgi:hypothetical protein